MHARTDFLPGDFIASSWPVIEPKVRALLERHVGSAREFEQWILDRSELEAACGEAKADLYINMTCDTEDAQAQEAYARYITEVVPKLTPAAFELDKRQVALAEQYPLPETRYAVLQRLVRTQVELFRPENVPIETELDLLGQKYEQTIGAMTVMFDGEEKTLPQMARYQELTDRSVREKAWRSVVARRMRDRDLIDGIYDEMVSKRDSIGRNAGFANYVGYAFKARQRFDYGVEQCEEFHAGVEAEVVPLMRSLDEDRRKKLGVAALRPWDMAVDVKGRPPLRPFSGGVDLMRKSVATFRRLDPRLGDMLATMGDGSNTRGGRDGACLDLDSRKGKAPGGYQYARERSRKSFIFMNAAGMAGDAETMLHEAGHAFHSMLCVDEPLTAYRSPPTEFAEVASMSMELMTMPHWGSGRDGHECFYPDEADLARARRNKLITSVTRLPWIATIDAFQIWVYSNPGHTREQRANKWLELDARFGPSVSWESLDSERETTWHRQLHLFTYPFYYIEYGIAQLGALQLWLMSLEKGERAAVEKYMAGLRLGGSRPLPDLFAAAGLEFSFGRRAIGRLVDRLRKELDKLPE